MCLEKEVKDAFGVEGNDPGRVVDVIRFEVSLDNRRSFRRKITNLVGSIMRMMKAVGAGPKQGRGSNPEDYYELDYAIMAINRCRSYCRKWVSKECVTRWALREQRPRRLSDGLSRQYIIVEVHTMNILSVA